MSLSDSQSRVMVFIADFIDENGYTPTIREITDGLGYGSTSTVHAHIQRLIALGYLEGSGRRMKLGWRARGSGRVGDTP